MLSFTASRNMGGGNVRSLDSIYRSQPTPHLGECKPLPPRQRVELRPSFSARPSLFGAALTLGATFGAIGMDLFVSRVFFLTDTRELAIHTPLYSILPGRQKSRVLHTPLKIGQLENGPSFWGIRNSAQNRRLNLAPTGENRSHPLFSLFAF